VEIQRLLKILCIIIDEKNGYIVTNAHVIELAGKIIVTLKDQRQFYAELVGKDLQADVAVIRIEPDRLILEILMV